MANNEYKYEHTHIPIKHGYATFIGKDFKPSDELLQALNKMAEIAYEQCDGLNVSTGERQLTIPDVSGSFCARVLTAKMIEARKYVDDYTERTGLKPTYRKVAEDLGIKSTAAYHRLRGYRHKMERKQ